jgi:hypothetical protein
MNAFRISPFSLDHVQLAFRGPKKLSTTCDDECMSCRKAVRAELVPEAPVSLSLSLILPCAPLFVNIVYNMTGDRQQVVLFPDELEEEQVRKLPYKENILEKYA